MAASERSRSPRRGATSTSAASRRICAVDSMPRPLSLMELPTRLAPFPDQELSKALAFDGEVYTKAVFLLLWFEWC